MDAPGNPFVPANAKAPVTTLPDAPGNPFVGMLPSKGLTEGDAMTKLQQSGVMDSDPGMRDFVKEHGARAALDAIHNRGGFDQQNLTDAAYQANYENQPWYEKLAENVGHGMEDALASGERFSGALYKKVDPFGTGALGQNAIDQANQWQQNADSNAAPINQAVARVAPMGSFWDNWAGQTAVQAPTFFVPGLDGSAPVLARMAEGAGQGAVAGALTPSDAQHPLQNAGIGAVLGAGAAPAAKAVSALGNYLGSHASNVATALRSGGERKIAGDILNTVTGGNIPAINPDQYVPNFKPTLSMLTKSPQVAAVENALVGKTLQDPIIAQRSANNVAATQAINSMKPMESPGSASARVVGALQDQYDRSLAAKNAAYGRIDPNNEFAIPFAAPKQQIGNYIHSLTPTSATLAPPTIRPVMQIPDMAPARDLLNASLDVGQDAQAARMAGNARGAKVAGKVKTAIDNALQNPDLRLNQPGFGTLGGAYPRVDPSAFVQNLQDAGDLAQAHYGRFGNNVIQPALQRFESVPAKSDPTQALQKILSDGSPEDVARLDQALGNSREGRQAVMSWLTNTLQDKASTQAQDMQGNPMLSAYKTANLLDRNEPLLRKFATPDQYGLLQRFRKSLEDNVYPANVKGLYGNSATAPLINTGNTLFDRASKLLGGGHGGVEAGAALGSAIGHAPGAAVGAKVGGLVDKALGKALEGRVRNVYELLSHAMADPDLARSLAQDASTPKAQTHVSKIAQAINASKWTQAVKRGAKAQLIRPFASGPSLPGSPFGARPGN